LEVVFPTGLAAEACPAYQLRLIAGLLDDPMFFGNRLAAKLGQDYFKDFSMGLNRNCVGLMR
jgi:hypothetical protein